MTSERKSIHGGCVIQNYYESLTMSFITMKLISTVILLLRPVQCASTVSSDKCDVCLMSPIFPLKLDKWRKNCMLGTRDNFIRDKSLMMSHLHFSIRTGPKIDHCPGFVEMSLVKWIAVRQSLI